MERLVPATGFPHTRVSAATSILLVLCVTSSLAAAGPVLALESASTEPCPTWHVRNNASTRCQCGSRLGNIITCNENTSQVSIVFGYCMTYSEDHKETVVGYCPYNVFYAFQSDSAYTPLPPNVSKLDSFMCGGLNRTGKLCGRCIAGYSPGIYSYEHTCVDCTEEKYGKIILGVFSQFFPATVLFILIVVFRVNASSGTLCAFVFFSQQVSLPAPSVLLLQAGKELHSDFVGVYSNLLLSFYGIWNLDFFLPFVPDVCLGKDVSIVPVLALGYVMPLYFLLLTVIAYVCIELHAHNWRPIVWMWRPFHRYLFRFRRTWNVKASIIDAFATLLLLSYAKTTFTAISTLYFTRLDYPSGGSSGYRYFFFDASVELGDKDYLPVMLTAILLLCTVVLFPMFVLVFYQFRWFQRYLHKCRLNRQGLRAFVEVLQGCYRDGVDGGHDLRFFAGLYLMFRMLVVVALTGIYGVGDPSLTFMLCTAVLSLCVALTFALLRPYKHFLYNIVDTLFFALLSAIFTTLLYTVNIELHNNASGWFKAAYSMLLVMVSLPAVYFAVVVFCWVYLKVRRRDSVRWDSQSIPIAANVFPDRVNNPSRYEPLDSESTERFFTSESTRLLGKSVPQQTQQN